MVHWLIPHGQATIGGSLQGRAYVSNHGPNVINCHVRLPLSIAATQTFEVSNASRIARLFSRPAIQSRRSSGVLLSCAIGSQHALAMRSAGAHPRGDERRDEAAGRQIRGDEMVPRATSRRRSSRARPR